MAEPLTARDAMQQAIRAMPRGSQLCEPLAVYQQVLDTVGDLPPLPMVLHKNGGRPHYLPRLKWLLRYFAVGQIGRTLTDLSRRYRARPTLGWAIGGEQKDREAVPELQQSLAAGSANRMSMIKALGTARSEAYNRNDGWRCPEVAPT